MARSKDPRYRQWRKEVINRDECCVICGSKKRLAAHHMNDWSHHKEDRYDVDNGITLCGRHHRMYHVKFHSDYRVICTKKDFNRFMWIVNECKGLDDG